MNIFECPHERANDWDEFVQSHFDGTMFHLFGWQQVLSLGLGHRTYYLAAERDGKLSGVLPLVHMESCIFGSTLSSLAFCAHAGPLATDQVVQDELLSAALNLAYGLNVGSLELRLRHPWKLGGPTKRLYDTFSKEIYPDPEENLQAMRSKQRNIVRKGIKNGLKSSIDSLDNFYRVYSESVRNLGTPVFPKRMFSRLIESFPDNIEFLSANINGVTVSSSMNFYFRDVVCPYYWGGTSAARELKGNDFLAWSIMNHSADRGYRTFDFGRSKEGTGAYQWKENLGFTPEPLFYEYKLVRDKEMPQINPLNPKYRIFVEGWKRLPLPIACALGPFLSRYLG